jgi:hypothetical protein
MAAPSPVIASLSWMPSRIALLLRESSFLSRFLRIFFEAAAQAGPYLSREEWKSLGAKMLEGMLKQRL